MDAHRGGKQHTRATPGPARALSRLPSSDAPGDTIWVTQTAPARPPVPLRGQYQNCRGVSYTRYQSIPWRGLLLFQGGFDLGGQRASGGFRL